MTSLISPHEFTEITHQLRSFFDNKGFQEVHTQNRLSILAACEDPTTVATYEYSGQIWPLPQTGQMWLEYEMLKNPEPPGYFCVSTSYRNEPNPVAGRHDLIFPMFEFELKGNMNDLINMEKELLTYLGYKTIEEGDYDDIAKKYNSRDLSHKDEELMYKDYGPAFLLKNFPMYTHPFWNMKYSEDKNHANKIDVILSGQETIGSAERSTSVEDMRNGFNTISNGMYAKTLYSKFSKERVDKELEEFLSNTFMPRSGGGIGLTRLIRSMKLEGLI